MTVDVQGFADLTVVVAGDLALDHYLVGCARRLSREAPVLVLEHDRDDYRPGAAANAAANLCALGCTVRAVGWVGEDSHGAMLLHELDRLGVAGDGVLSVPGATTCVKTRVVGGVPDGAVQQIVRVDRGTSTLPAGARRALRRRLEEALAGADAVILSDYSGTTICDHLLARARAVSPSIADSRQRLRRFSGVTAATPSVEEASAALDRSVHADVDDEVSGAAVALRHVLACEAMLITRGAAGMTLATAAGVAHLRVPGEVEASDVSGAGDTVTAVFAASRAAGATFHEAAHAANAAAYAAVQRRGAAAVSRDDVRRSLAALA